MIRIPETVAGFQGFFRNFCRCHANAFPPDSGLLQYLIKRKAALINTNRDFRFQLIGKLLHIKIQTIAHNAVQFFHTAEEVHRHTALGDLPRQAVHAPAVIKRVHRCVVGDHGVLHGCPFRSHVVTFLVKRRPGIQHAHIRPMEFHTHTLILCRVLLGPRKTDRCKRHTVPGLCAQDFGAHTVL